MCFSSKTLKIDVSTAGGLKFTTNVAEISGKFEIRDDRGVVVSGHVQYPADIRKERTPDRYFDGITRNTNDDITKKQFYKHLATKQYQYNDHFKQLESANGTIKIFWR